MTQIDDGPYLLPQSLTLLHPLARATAPCTLRAFQQQWEEPRQQQREPWGSQFDHWLLARPALRTSWNVMMRIADFETEQTHPSGAGVSQKHHSNIAHFGIPKAQFLHLKIALFWLPTTAAAAAAAAPPPPPPPTTTTTTTPPTTTTWTTTIWYYYYYHLNYYYLILSASFRQCCFSLALMQCWPQAEARVWHLRIFDPQADAQSQVSQAVTWCRTRDQNSIGSHSHKETFWEKSLYGRCSSIIFCKANNIFFFE